LDTPLIFNVRILYQGDTKLRLLHHQKKSQFELKAVGLHARMSTS